MSDLSLSSLVHEITRSDAQDRERQRELFGELVRASERVRAYGQPEIDFLMYLATEFTHFLAEGSPPSLEDVQRMVTRLMVNAECKTHRYLENACTRVHAVTEESESEAQPKAALPSPSDTESAPPSEALRQKELKLANTRCGQSDYLDLRRVKLGQVLEHLGLADSNQINHALMVQGGSNQRIGEVLSRLGQLQPRELRAALELHTKAREYAVNHARTGKSGGVQMPYGEWFNTLLGELLFSAEAINKKQLDQAIAIQRATGMRMGEVLVHHGFCDKQTVLSAIALQEKLRNSSRTDLGATSA